MYTAEDAPAPVMKISRGLVGARMGPAIEACSVWVPMETRPECEGWVCHGLSLLICIGRVDLRETAARRVLFS